MASRHHDPGMWAHPQVYCQEYGAVLFFLSRVTFQWCSLMLYVWFNALPSLYSWFNKSTDKDQACASVELHTLTVGALPFPEVTVC